MDFGLSPSATNPFGLLHPAVSPTSGQHDSGIFNFWNTIIWDAIHSALRSKACPPSVYFNPLSSIQGQKALNNGWVVLYVVHYPDLVTSQWIPVQSIINGLYHLWQDLRRYRVSSELIEALERLGAIKSGIPILEYSIRSLEYYAVEDLSLGRSGFRILQKYMDHTTSRDRTSDGERC
ncbi:hypothetical protein V8F33_008470 [Rhypophila sp. PSN 637]